ncbi:uncharacterized protein LOC125941158 [Dermacentor silvarum]|uniref:uncharacterized protein LOC125941158 n=1 Tax=Dermacentor silvarum TaxID=543639 RepID=UPI002100884D|nr:uncharacterized protein LOC125941158 [Dermacentor silvarum]
MALVCTVAEDIWGVPRGRCGECECDGFRRTVELISHERVPLGWCILCGHSPVAHGALTVAPPLARGEMFAAAAQPMAAAELEPHTSAEVSAPTTSPSTSSNLQHTTVTGSYSTTPDVISDLSTSALVPAPRMSQPQLHVSAPLPANLPVEFTHMCQHCTFSTKYFSRFAIHMSENHLRMKRYTCFTCTVTFGALARYKKHWDENHAVSLTTAGIPMVRAGCAPLSPEHPSADLEYECQPPSLSDEARLSDLCRMLEGKHRCRKTAVDTVVQGVSEMFRAKDFYLDISQLKNDKGRKLLYEHNHIYVRPCEKILPNGSKAYYVPLRQLLANLLRHPEAAQYLLRPISSSGDGYLRDFNDGMRFRSHALFKEKRNALGLLVYCDDVEMANSLGMKRGACGKLTIFYIMFANFPPSKRSQTNSIFFLAVGQSNDLKTTESKA